MASTVHLYGCESWATIHQNSNKKENKFAEIKILSPLKSSQNSNIFLSELRNIDWNDSNDLMETDFTKEH
jgi:hypothetical protein